MTRDEKVQRVAEALISLSRYDPSILAEGAGVAHIKTLMEDMGNANLKTGIAKSSLLAAIRMICDNYVAAASKARRGGYNR